MPSFFPHAGVPQRVSNINASRATPTRLAFTWPEGPRDAEALAVLPDGRALLVTKGRDTPIALYTLHVGDGAGAPTAPRVAQRVAQLAPMPDDRRQRVGAAAASEDGAWIAIRTEVELAVFRTDALLRGETTPAFTRDHAEGPRSISSWMASPNRTEAGALNVGTDTMATRRSEAPGVRMTTRASPTRSSRKVKNPVFR
jgi:hypothetical protein